MVSSSQTVDQSDSGVIDDSLQWRYGGVLKAARRAERCRNRAVRKQVRQQDWRLRHDQAAVESDAVGGDEKITFVSFWKHVLACSVHRPIGHRGPPGIFDVVEFPVALRRTRRLDDSRLDV